MSKTKWTQEERDGLPTPPKQDQKVELTSIERVALKPDIPVTPHEQKQERESTGPRTQQPPGPLSKPGAPGAERAIAQMQEPRLRSRKELVKQRIIYPEMKDKRVCHSFRHLRTTLFQNAGMSNFVLMVTGVSSKSGASFVARNLAAAVAFDKTKTALLVDCNLRKPAVDDLIINDGDLLGLTDYLSGSESNIEKIIYPTGIPRLRAIPAGLERESATECFSAPQLHTLLEEIRERYPERRIVVDAPPINEPDARILGHLCDYVLLVIPYGRATKTQIMSATSVIGPERLCGTVFNDVPAIWLDRT